MASFDNSYSRLVAWLKILLPLLALAILSTMFLVSRSIDPSQSIPYAEVNATDLARDQGISSPVFSSVTDDGSAISISAELAKPYQNDNQKISVQGLLTTMETNGAEIRITALNGAIDTANQELNLTGGVELTTSTGYQILTDNIQSSLATTEIIADQPITANGPMGDLQADSMRLTLQNETPNGVGYLLVFKGRVKLVYNPQR